MTHADGASRSHSTAVATITVNENVACGMRLCARRLFVCMGIVVHRGCRADPEKRYRYITLSSMYCRMVVLSFFLAVVSSSSALMRAAYERCTRPSRDGKVTRPYEVAWHDMVGIYNIV